MCADNAPGKIPLSERIPTWLPLVVIAGGLLVVLEAIDALIALPLRELSATIACFLLNCFSIPVERQGTLLVADNFTWDVVPACSGSTSLRVLLTSAVIWCGLQPGMPWLRKILCMLAAVPLALLANGTRVAVLTYLGTLSGKPVEGILHHLIGLAAIVLGMGLVVLLTALATPGRLNEARPRNIRGAVLALLLLLLYAPALTWILLAWRDSPLDRIGPVYLLLGLGCIVSVLYRGRHSAGQPRSGTILFAASLIVLLTATVIDISILKSAAFLFSWFSLIVFFRGMRIASYCLPGLFICSLGLPTVTYQLSTYVFSQLGPLSELPYELLKVLLALVGILTTAILLVRPTSESTEAPRTSATLRPLLFLTSAALILQVLYLNSATRPEAQLDLAVSHFQGEWNGIDLPLSPAAVETIGRSRIISRRYTDGEHWVELLITSTGGDRRRAHAPEYCLTGSGWLVCDRARQQLDLPDRPVDVHFLKLRRDGSADRVLAYWFTDGKQNWDSFPKMLAEDTLRRLRGEVTDWHVVRLIAEDAEDLIAFAGQLQLQH